ncbi:MAG TPA: zinc-binding dehydrogenase, partial [Anaeromyxobacter sp.]
VFSYIAKREDLERGAAELFEVVRSGKVRIDVSRTLPLADAAEAHRLLESRATTGSLVLVP